jgi:transcriptional regulator with XRE-family HTH domain
MNKTDDCIDMAKPNRESNWGVRLKAVLKEKGYSLRKAAKVAGVSPSVLDSWTSGSTPKDLQAVKMLADELSVSISWLLLGEHEARESMATVAEIFDESPYFDGYA